MMIMKNVRGLRDALHLHFHKAHTFQFKLTFIITDQDVGGYHLVAGEPDDVAHPDVLPETLDIAVEAPAIDAKKSLPRSCTEMLSSKWNPLFLSISISTKEPNTH